MSQRSIDPEQQAKVLKRLKRFSRLMDARFGIPFTRFRVGYGSLIGLVPVVGDTIDLVLSLYVLFQARKLGASGKLQLQMLVNLAIDYFGGLVPVIGDVFDIAFKANIRNTELLIDWLKTQPRS
jgi:hypothetical protein